MKRFALALSAIVVAVVVSSCGVGVRQPATNITDTSATLNGKVLSTTGGPGSYYIEYGPTAARTERTPTRTINFDADQSYPISEPVDGLEPGTRYHFAVCAEDSENPGNAFCSPDQTFTTDSDATLMLTENCDFYEQYGLHGVEISATGFPPNAPIHFRLQYPPSGGTVVDANYSTDAGGNFRYGPTGGAVRGLWTGRIDWAGGTLEESLFVDCAEPSDR
jgi:hypothetical protein